MTKEEKRELEEKIENHPIFALSEDERFDAVELRNKFAELMMEYMGFLPDKQILDKQILDASEEGRPAAPIPGAFDGVAFMNAIKILLKQDHLKIVNVCSYFRTIYINKRKDLLKKEQAFRPSEEIMRNIREINKLCEASGRHIWDLSDQDIRRFAAALGTAPEKLSEQITLYRRTQVVSPTFEDKDGTEKTLEISDMTIYSEFGPEELDLITYILDQVLETDQREYPRLFWNNALLRLLKGDYMENTEDPLPKGEPALLNLYREREKPLLTKVFVHNYLLFVLEQPPEPDTIDHIDEAGQEKAFIDATIAAYKQVTRPAVSRQRTRFNRMLKNLKSDIRQGGF